MPPDHALPDDAFEETYLAGSGPGGQNANKVATAVQLRVDLARLDLPPPVLSRLRRLAGARLTNDDSILLTARSHRTQEANRREAMGRFEALLAKARQRPKYRVKTKPSRAAKAKRVDAKKQRSAVKKARGKPRLD